MRSAEQALELELSHQRFNAVDFLGQLRSERGILVGHLEHRRQIAGGRNGFFQWPHDGIQRLQLDYYFLGFLRVVPKGRLGHASFDGGHLRLLGRMVKESLVAGPAALG